MNRNVIRQFPFTQIEQCPAKSPLSRWVRNDGIARSSGPWATSRAERIRSSLGTWSAWTPFFVPSRYSFSRPLGRKLKITLSLYRVTWRDTTTFTPGSWPRARPASAPLASLRREAGDALRPFLPDRPMTASAVVPAKSEESWLHGLPADLAAPQHLEPVMADRAQR